MIIRTAYTTNAAGRGQIVAKGGGRQRTVAFDLSKTADWNHGAAAGTLALVLGLKYHDGIPHECNESGTRRSFEF